MGDDESASTWGSCWPSPPGGRSLVAGFLCVVCDSYVLYVIGHFAPIVRDARAAALAFICTGAHTKALEMDISHRHKRA